MNIDEKLDEIFKQPVVDELEIPQWWSDKAKSALKKLIQQASYRELKKLDNPSHVPLLTRLHLQMDSLKEGKDI